MLRRRKAGPEASSGLRDAFVRFRHTVAAVEEAKEALAAAAPGGRSSGAPLAEALAAFDECLGEARGSMPSWRRPGLDEVWGACRRGLEEAMRRAERFRLGDTPEGYEQLYGELADLMEPLDAFAVALDRFHELGL